MKNTSKIGIVLIISLCFFIAEIAVGFRTRSIALIADAFHYLNDIVAYAIAFIAAYLQERGEHTDSFTFAFHRAELVGAFFNGVFLLALALSICLQSIERFVNLETIDSPRLVMIIGCVGLGLNIISILVVHDHHGHGHSHGNAAALRNSTELRATNSTRDHIHAEHNHRVDPPSSSPQHNLGLLGVLVHVFGDAVNNVGVIVAAIIMWKLKSPHRFYADPAVSMIIGFIIFGSAIPMTLKSGRVLLEAAPLHLDLAKVKEDLVTVPHVLSVHDFHVWHLSQTVILASLHVCISPGTTMEQWEKTEEYLQHCFGEYGINHVTISPEIQRDSQTTSFSNDEVTGKCCFPSSGDFGCAVGELKRRKAGTV